MQRNAIGKSDKVVGEKMSISALSEAKGWYEKLLDAEFRGRKDTEGAARYRLARRLGISETKLFRLQYKYEEMADVAGEVYRRLMLAMNDLSQKIEDATDAKRAELARLKEMQCNEKATRGHMGLATGDAASEVAAAQGEKRLAGTGDASLRGQEAGRQ